MFGIFNFFKLKRKKEYEERIKFLENELQEVAKVCSDNENYFQNLEDELATTSAELEMAQKELERAEKEIENLLEEVNYWKQQYVNLQQENRMLEMDNAKLMGDY